MYNTEKLKARIAEKFGNQKEFSKKIGISRPTLCRYLKNGSDWKGSYIIRAIRALEIPDSEVDAYFFAPMVAKSEPKKERKVTR